MESGAGGRFYARKADGSERPMGEVLAWEPPSRLTYSWFPGTSEALPTEIDIFFSQEGGHLFFQYLDKLLPGCYRGKHLFAGSFIFHTVDERFRNLNIYICL